MAQSLLGNQSKLLIIGGLRPGPVINFVPFWEKNCGGRDLKIGGFQDNRIIQKCFFPRMNETSWAKNSKEEAFFFPTQQPLV